MPVRAARDGNMDFPGALRKSRRSSLRPCSVKRSQLGGGDDSLKPSGGSPELERARLDKRILWMGTGKRSKRLVKRR